MALKRLARTLTRILNNYTGDVPYDQIPRNLNEVVSKSPFLRREFKRVSIEEDEMNSYYSGILSTLAEHCVGSVPLVLGSHELDLVNDAIEDQWRDWTVENGIGSIIRQVRRGAARTGIGIAVPYYKPSAGPLGLGFKTVSAQDLITPRAYTQGQRIVDGIEYDDNWDPIKIYVKSDDPFVPKEYRIEDIIFWHKHMHEGMVFGLPECYSAFCLFPSVRRFIDAIVASEEFRSAIPMAVELDKDVYRPEDATDVPTGTTKYRPGTIVTLPPGTKLSGLPISISSEERTQFIKMVVGAAARCLQMPYNIALGDSSGHNMATAAIDIQPWEDKVKIDRNDFEPVIRKVFSLWYQRAILVSGYLPIQARSGFKYDLTYTTTFQHPDPQKRANARAIDLASGASTLHEIYTEGKGKNPRRQLDREARTLGITRERLNELIIAKRVGINLTLTEEEGDDSNQPQDDQE